MPTYPAAAQPPGRRSDDVEAIFYAIARGLARGLLDGAAECLRAAHTAVDEAPSDLDRLHAVRFRDAVCRLLRTSGDPIANGPASAGQAGKRDDLVPHE